MGTKNVSVDEKGLNLATQRAQQLPASTQFAIVQVLPNIENGAFWGFTTVSEVQKYSEALRQDKNIILRKIRGGVVIEIPPTYMLNALSAIDPSILTSQRVKEMQDGIVEACVVFEKFLSKSKPDFKGRIGVYCINDVSSILLNGKNIPSFRLPLANVLALLAKYGFKVLVGERLVPASRIDNTMMPELWNSVVLSPTSTGCFIEISR